MSEIQILSNASSSLLASSYAGQSADLSEYVYDMDRSTVNKAINRLVEVRVNNPSLGKTHSVELPSFGILNKLVVKSTFQVGSVAIDADNCKKIRKSLYSALFQECAIMNSSRRVFTLPGEMIAYLVQALPAEQREKWLIAGMDTKIVDENGIKYDLDGSVPIPVNTIFTVYTPLFFSCFEEGGAKNGPFKSNFNTRFLEKLNVMIHFNEKELIWGSTVDIALKACDILCDFHIIEQKSLDKIEEANYSLSSNLAQVMSNFTVVTSAPQTYTGIVGDGLTLQLMNDQLVHSLVVCVTCTHAGKDKKEIGDKEHAQKNSQRFVGVRKIKLTSAGRVIYETKTQIESLLLGSNDAYMGYHAEDLEEALVSSGERSHNAFYLISFANDTCDTSKIAGCCAFKNLNSCRLQVYPMDTENLVTTATAAGATAEYKYTVRCFVRYYQAIATSANSGRIQISLSS
jgi:hypothetical protein